MNNNAKENYKQQKKDENDGEIDDKELVPEFLRTSTLLLLYMTEKIRKDIEF